MHSGGAADDRKGGRHVCLIYREADVCNHRLVHRRRPAAGKNKKGAMMGPDHTTLAAFGDAMERHLTR